MSIEPPSTTCSSRLCGNTVHDEQFQPRGAVGGSDIVDRKASNRRFVGWLGGWHPGVNPVPRREPGVGSQVAEHQRLQVFLSNCSIVTQVSIVVVWDSEQPDGHVSGGNSDRKITINLRR